MQRIIALVSAVVLLLFSFSENKIYNRDIRNRLVIQGIGIDVDRNGEFTVTIQAIDTNSQSVSSSDGASQPPIKAYTVTGETIYTAIKGVTEFEGKTPLYSQNRIIILGKSITEKNMDSVIDFFVRDVETDSGVFIAAAENEASEILQVKNGEEYVTARSIEKSITAYEYDGRIYGLQLFELINRYNSGTKDFAMPLLKVVKDGDNKSVEVTGTALFNNTRYREKISKEQTVFLNFLSDNIYGTALAFDWKDGASVSLNVVSSRVMRQVALQKGKPVFKIKIFLQADIAEISGGVSVAMGDEELRQIRKTGEEYVSRQTKSLINTLYNDYDSDSAGLARLLYIFEKDFYRKNEKNLDSVLQKSSYEVETELKLRRVGQEFVS